MKNTAVEFFADQLNTDPDLLADTLNSLNRVTDKNDVIEKLYEEVHEKVLRILKYLNINHQTAEVLFKNLENNIAELDKKLFDSLGKPVCNTSEGCKNLISVVLDK